MRVAVGVLMVVGGVVSAACGSTDGESAPATAPVDVCAEAQATSTTLAAAQFAFIGIVTSVEDRVHPWTTDPENPDRPATAAPTRWVGFDVAGWYTTDRGPTFRVWMPTIAARVGDRLAVAGEAYHTEVEGFSGPSGEVASCVDLAGTDGSPASWDRLFGASTPPGPAPTEPAQPPTVGGTKIFGEQPEPCPPSVLTHGPDDERIMADGAACFLDAYAAGQPVVWDVVVPTEEGAPIPSRYEFDGDALTITTDDSHDDFGSGGVSELRCSDVRPTAWLPEGLDCVSSAGDGFAASSLPFGA